MHRDGDSRISGTVENAVPGVVVLQVPYRPGWQLTVNGEPAELLRVNRGLLGVLLEEPGSYQLDLQYWPSLWTYSFAMFPMGLLGLWFFMRSRFGRLQAGAE